MLKPEQIAERRALLTASDRIVIDSIHEAADGKPNALRIEIYRAHARTTGRDSIAKHLFECADELEAAEKRCLQLVLNFQRRAEG